MATTELDIIRAEQERSNLLRAIASVETAIAVSTPGTRRVLENTLENAKKHVMALDKQIADAKVEHEAEQQAQMAAANLADKEKALSAGERETYGGFLKEAFFTKKDFGKLEQFYAHSWDRLSDGGKDEMSHRVWEGVRHNEYRFNDLPKDVQEAESKRLYTKLTAPMIGQGSLASIPEADRSDFVRSYEAGNHTAAAEVLNRDSFRRNVALEKAVSANHKTVNFGKASDDETVLARDNPSQTEKIPADALKAAATGKFDSINLKGVTLADASSEPSTAAIPDVSGARVSVRSPC